ncbi:MAG: bifunctional phosphopantothenoylcysteine decarboxylase/phosphopantothenate--cysteine ligase CoaBC [Myxococcota bacterium]
MSRVLVGVSGGIAAYKACELVRLLQNKGHEVRVAATPNALRFVSALTLQTLTGHPVRAELFSLTEESEISHIDLADWPEVVAVAPATAATIARLAHGIADDFLSTVCLATRAPVVVAPAMNVNMYNHPATRANLDLLAERGVRIVGPGTGELACGWEGEGRLADLEEIAGELEQLLSGGDLRGKTFLVTAGPTAEPIDPVRVITNRSSGRMGFAVAEEAARRGADVMLVSGPVSLPTPFGVKRVDVETMAEMRETVLEMLDPSDVVVLAAAVADYSLPNPSERKLKRAESSNLVLELTANPDLSREVGLRKGDRTVVTFAAETEDLIENARGKLERKGCDLVVANDVSRADIGFGTERNEVEIIGPDPQEVIHVPSASKNEVAGRILDRIREILK